MRYILLFAAILSACTGKEDVETDSTETTEVVDDCETVELIGELSFEQISEIAGSIGTVNDDGTVADWPETCDVCEYIAVNWEGIEGRTWDVCYGGIEMQDDESYTGDYECVSECPE